MVASKDGDMVYRTNDARSSCSLDTHISMIYALSTLATSTISGKCIKSISAVHDSKFAMKVNFVS